MLDEKETAIEAQKEPVTIEAGDQGLTEINETSISELMILLTLKLSLNKYQLPK